MRNIQQPRSPNIGVGKPDQPGLLDFLRRRSEQQMIATVEDATTPPTGTGMRHVTAGVEDAAAKLIDESDIAADNKDGLGSKESLRTLGTGSQQACAGNDARLSDARTPLAHAHAGADIASGTIAPDRLGSGSGGATKFLREDSTWQAVGGGSTPTGTGFRHVTAGVEDAASKLVDTADVNDAQVTLAKMANLTGPTAIGRESGAGAPVALTPEQVTLALVNTFTSLLKGAVPASGGGTSNFLRADGSWAAPGGGGSPSYSPGSFTVATEEFLIKSRHLKLTTTERATLAGTGTLRIT